MQKKSPKLLNITKSEGSKKAFYFFITLAVLMLIWWVLAETVFKHNAGVPSPPEVFDGVLTAAISGKLWTAAAKTVGKAFLGFTFSFLLGFILAILSNWFKRAKYCLDPIVTVIRAFPTLGITFLLLMYLGTPETAVIIGALVIFPVFYAAFYSAIKNLDSKILQMADVYRVGKAALVFKIYLPGIASAVFAAVLSAFALNLKVVIAAEIVGGVAPNTIGNFMAVAVSENNYAGVFTWVTVAILLAFLAEAIIKLVMRLCMPWERGAQIANIKLQTANTDDNSKIPAAAATPAGSSALSLFPATSHSSLLAPRSPRISFQNVTFSYPAACVFKNFSAEFSHQKIHCVFGPSGSGKTTLLNLVAGLYAPQKGSISFFEADCHRDAVRSQPRSLQADCVPMAISVPTVSYMFQEPRLIPERTVLKNLTLVLEPVLTAEGKRRSEIKAEAEARALAMLDAVGLKHAAHLYPRALSGGMAQRVSLARAFLVPSQVLLMDEPFRGFDYSLQKSVRGLFLWLLEQHPKTVLMVTHDADEVVMLSDEIHRFCEFSPVTAFTEISIPTPRTDRKIGSAELNLLKEKLLCD